MDDHRYLGQHLQGPGGLTRSSRLVSPSFGLALANASLADTHPLGNVSLSHDADNKTQRLLHPLGNPFSWVNAASFDYLPDAFGKGVGLASRALVEPCRPFCWERLR